MSAFETRATSHLNELYIFYWFFPVCVYLAGWYPTTLGRHELVDRPSDKRKIYSSIG